MRTARLVGLSPDGKSLIVATESGEEFMIEADERLRAALRGDRPRLGQLENEMETSLTPRDIQARIRAGGTLEDVARVAGMAMDRVERFAAPVLAEREHVASMAMASSVRRRGEPSGHRSLRITVTERLLGRGVDLDAIRWDSYRLDDGRWAVTADYQSGDASRHASFFYDLRGRFSVAANDEARWLLGDQPSSRGSQRGRPRLADESTEVDTEPTLVSDQLALAKAAHEAARNQPSQLTNNQRRTKLLSPPFRCAGCCVRSQTRPTPAAYATRRLMSRRWERSTRCSAATATARIHRGCTRV